MSVSHTFLWYRFLEGIVSKDNSHAHITLPSIMALDHLCVQGIYTCKRGFPGQSLPWWRLVQSSPNFGTKSQCCTGWLLENHNLIRNSSVSEKLVYHLFSFHSILNGKRLMQSPSHHQLGITSHIIGNYTACITLHSSIMPWIQGDTYMYVPKLYSGFTWI